MYISTFYGVVKQSNGYFKIFYPVYNNVDINPVVNASEFNSFSTAHNQADLAYLDLQSALANVDNISVYGNYELLYENNNYLIQQVVLEVTISQSSDPDYTNILTSINTNLTNLNTNIVNKNNQSDIVSCLNNIFCYTLQNGNNVSAFKDNLQYQTANDNPKRNLTLCNMLFHIYAMLLNDTSNKNSLDSSINKRTLLDISKKICYLTPTQNSDNNSIFRILRIIALSLSKDSNVNLSNDSNVVSSASLKDISDKLANSNDLHTISQAIDLISTAIAQTPTTDTTGLQTELGKISTAVNNIENNPLFELNANVNGIEVCKKNNKNELDF